MYLSNGEANIGSGSLFDQVAHRARIHRLGDIRIITVRGKHEHFGGGDGFENLASGLKTIEQRHPNVHQNQCGTKLVDHRNRLTAVFRFADHVKIVFKFQNLFEFLAHDPVVIRQQDGDSFHGYCYVRNVRALACLICVSWPGVSGTGILFISLSSRTSVGIESAGCWLLAAGCWLLAAGCCDATTPFLLRALFTVLILTTKALSALWGVHLIGEVNRLMVNGRPVASEFLGFRRGSTSKKPDINPTNPT